MLVTRLLAIPGGDTLGDTLGDHFGDTLGLLWGYPAGSFGGAAGGCPGILWVGSGVILKRFWSDPALILGRCWGVFGSTWGDSEAIRKRFWEFRLLKPASSLQGVARVTLCGVCVGLGGGNNTRGPQRTPMGVPHPTKKCS